MSNEKEKAFFVTGLLGSLLYRAAQQTPQETLVKLEIVRSRDHETPKVDSLPVPVVSQRDLPFSRRAPRYLLEQLRANEQETRTTSVIGRDVTTGKLCSISDVDRRTGLYILGKSGMGKSWLLVNLMLQDIEHGHGLVFIDPHGRAIEDLLNRVCTATTNRRHSDCLLYDPENETHSLGINILRCADISSINARQDTYTRAKGVFDKIWKIAYYEVPWLQEIIQYTLYAFIENQDYTLGDAPLFLTDRTFREHIVSNMRYNLHAAKFWRERFDPKRVDAALTRVDALLGDPYVHDILSQRETSIDFAEAFEKKKIILIRLSDRLSKDVKTFIGTILISELVDAVKKRPTANPDQFCVYVDEFQNFSSYDDFETLITGGRKYGIATTIAHQERYGQFAEDRGILGATDAAGNKICFQLSVRDAQERAADFSDEPPNETKREPELVITPNPLSFLLEKGHKSPQIRAFVDKYLRHMQHKREDAREDMEGVRLKRMKFLDQAGIYMADERIESLESNDEYIRGAYLDARRGALVGAQAQTGVLLNLFDTSKNLRLTMRGLNSFLNAIMEKRISCGEEAFSDFLVSLCRGFSGVAAEYASVLEFYIALRCGEAKTARQVPFEFARAHGFFPQSVAETFVDVEQKRKDKKREFMKKELYFYTYEEKLKSIQGYVAEWTIEKSVEYAFARRVADWRIKTLVEYAWRDEDVVAAYLYFDRYPQLQEWLRPYCEAKFKTEWKVLVPSIDHLISEICNKTGALGDSTREIAVDGEVIASIAAFLKRYRESAFVVFSLIMVARFWTSYTPPNHDNRWLKKWPTEYPGINMLGLPAIAGKEPLEIFLLVRNINEYLSRQDAKQDLLQYFCLKGKPMEEQIRLGRWYGGRDNLYDRLTRTEHYHLCSYPLLRETEERVDVRLLRHECDRRRGWLEENLSRFETGWWDGLNDGERLYLLFRACDMAIYGAAVANRTWPQPEIAGLSPGRISWLVSLLASLLTDVRREVEEKGFDVPLGESYSSELIPVPTHLPLRLLDSFEKRALQEACKEELLKADQKTQKVVATISDFVTFCELLAEPDNHIQVPSGQYTEKQVPSRHELDMVNQRVRELLELPKYAAYAKVLQEVDGQQRVWKGKIQTLKLKDITDNFLLQQAAISARGVIYIQSREKLKSREQIAREIAERQENWRRRAADEPPATQSENKPEIVKIAQLRKRSPFLFSFEDILWVPKEPVVIPEDEPPPSHS